MAIMQLDYREPTKNVTTKFSLGLCHFSICDLKREIKLVANGLNKKYLLSYLYMYIYTCVCINAFLRNSVTDP